MGERSNPGKPILQIENLSISYKTRSGWLNAVHDFSLEICAGQTYGLVGESGSGKTTIILALMRYLEKKGRVDAGRILLNGVDLLALPPAEMRKIWGKSITLVPQNPLSALNPSIRVGEQLAETLRLHNALNRSMALERTIALLDMVHIAEPERVAQSYPHQISGGMQQRVMIAMALSTEPDLLVLDEPTTSLDVTTQAVVLDLVRELIKDRRTAALYVTHNLGVVAQVCDRVAVIYAGELVENAATMDIFTHPVHPYTIGLLDSIPRLGENKTSIRLRAIQGQIPPLGERSAGCVFMPRCPVALEICGQRPELAPMGSQRTARCHRKEEILTRQIDPHQPEPDIPPYPGIREGVEILDVDELTVHYPLRRSLMDVFRRTPRQVVRAVNGASLSISRGRTLGLVGESGSGKTTLSRSIAGLVEKTSGEVRLLDMPLPADLNGRSLDTLRHLQMVFQNPEEALNPHLTVGESLQRPLFTLLKMQPAEAVRRVAELLQAVRLPADYANRRPAQLSGGEKQRVAIARAFASNPDLLIADEPVSSLDVSVQASILNLLNELQSEFGSSLLFISHNLAVVGFLADEVAVIYLGRLMEISATENLFTPPYHPYTESLLSAIPVADPAIQRGQIRLTGDLPGPTEEINGCPFYTRCPRFLGDICVNQKPPWQEDANGSKIFCHIPLAELEAVQHRVVTLQAGSGETGAG